jgi:hypothetical protein
MNDDQIKQQLIRDYKETFASEGGKRVLADLRKRCEPIILDSPIDPYQTHIDLGKRIVMTHIVRQIEREMNIAEEIENLNERNK